MEIAIASDRRIYDKDAVLLNNLYKTQPEGTIIHCIIEDDYLPNYIMPTGKDITINFININNYPEFLNYMSKVPNLGTWGKMTCARLFFPKMLKSDKVIYLDIDVLVRKPLDELWNLDIEDYYVAGVQDFGWYNFGWCNDPALQGIQTYINAGVLLMNLKKMRKDNLMQKFFILLTSLQLSFLDQHVINIACNGKIYYLDTRFNPCFLNGRVSNPIIYHGTLYKPWDPRCEWYDEWMENVSI